MPFKPRGDRVVAIATQRRQQATMAKVAHAALKEYIRHVRAAVGHTAIRAAADPNQPEHPNVDLNALDQSVVWPAILKRTILPEIDKIILGLGPQKHMTPAVVSSVNAWRAQWMAARTQRLVGVPASITRQIRDAIQEAADLNGPDPGEAADIVKSLLNPDAPTWASRAMTIARTEVIGANNQGGLASWTAVHQSLAPSGGQVFKTWLATSDEKTRPDHAEIDGTEIPISQTFTVGGQQMNGPGDDSADADEVIRCRCTLTYRVDDGTAAGDSLSDAEEADTDDVEATDVDGTADAEPSDADPLLPDLTDADLIKNAEIQFGSDRANWSGQDLKAAAKIGDADAKKELDDRGLTASGSTTTDAAGDDGADEGLTAATEVPVTAPAVTAPPQSDGTPSEAAPPSPVGAMQWSGVLAELDVPSSDGRMIASSGLTVRTLPLPLSYQAEGEHGGDLSGTTVIVGRILTCTIDGGVVKATGDFFDPMTSDAPMAAIEQVAGGIGNVSVNLPVQIVSYLAPGPGGVLLPIDPMQYMGDPDSIIMVAEQSEIAGACIVDCPAFGTARIEIVANLSIPDLGPVTADAATPEGPILTPDAVTFPDGTVLKVGDQVNVIGAMGADTPSTGLIESINPDTNEVTVAVEDPASPGKTDSVTVDATSLDVVDDGTDDTTAPADDTAGLTAALAFPGLEQEHVYPAEWFSLPDLDDIDHQPHLRVTEEGQVLGLLAQSGSCHIGFANECVAPPTSPANYAYFHVGEVKTDQGFLPVGKVTVGGGHADLKLGYRGATEHYDNAGAAAAVLRAYDTQIGVVVAGALLPQATPEQIAALRRNDLSGDWRPIGGNRELVAALSVNTGGFPLTPRAALAADGRPMALVAAGVVHGTEPRPGVELPSGVKLSAEDVAVLASAFAEVSVKQQADMKHAQRRAAEARALRTNLIRTKLHSVS